jgi:hypothetical protein
LGHFLFLRRRGLGGRRQAARARARGRRRPDRPHNRAGRGAPHEGGARRHGREAGTHQWGWSGAPAGAGLAPGGAPGQTAGGGSGGGGAPRPARGARRAAPARRGRGGLQRFVGGGSRPQPDLICSGGAVDGMRLCAAAGPKRWGGRGVGSGRRRRAARARTRALPPRVWRGGAAAASGAHSRRWRAAVKRRRGAGVGEGRGRLLPRRAEERQRGVWVPKRGES